MVRIKWYRDKGKTVSAVAIVDRADMLEAPFIEPLSYGNREDIRDGKIANRLFVDWCFGGWCEVNEVI